MSSRHFEPALYSIRGSDLPLSGAALAELMRAVLSRGVPFRFRALGQSMLPFIRDGDIVWVYPLRCASLRLGEVVAFVHPQSGRLVVHRIIGGRPPRYRVRGDNTAASAEELIPLANILGRVTRVQRHGRRVWLGLGPERCLVALISRLGLKSPLRCRALPFLRRVLGRCPR